MINDRFVIFGPGENDRKNNDRLREKILRTVGIKVNVPEDKRKLKVGMISGWTLTAIDLWNDKNFIEKRIKEQEIYLTEILWKQECGLISKYRYFELRENAVDVLDRFEQRLKELRNEIVH